MTLGGQPGHIDRRTESLLQGLLLGRDQAHSVSVALIENETPPLSMPLCPYPLPNNVA